MKKLLLAALALFSGLPALAQNAYPLFAPADGILVGDQNTYITTPATSSNVRALWSGTCNLDSYLRGDGVCSLIDLTNDVTGTLPILNGGTGKTSLGDLTRTNDTNVTLTLGGTPVGSLINSTSLTLGWTGTLAASRGGLGFSTVTDDTIPIANGSGWVSSALPGCLDTSGNHLNYNASTNSVFCGTSSSVSPVTPANPTATIGLTAVNGTSPNFIRSDGAPALSQAIVPTWTGIHTFTNAANGVTIQNDTGSLLFRNSTPTAVLQAGTFRSIVGSGSLTDAGIGWFGTNLSFLANSRSLFNLASGSLTFGNTTDNPTYNFTGSGLSTFGGAGQFNGDHVGIASTDSYYEMRETDQGADAKVWWTRGVSGNYAIQTRTDALGAGKDALQITRSGTAIGQLAFGNTSDNPAYNFQGTGATTFGGAASVSGLFTDTGANSGASYGSGEDFTRINNTSTGWGGLAFQRSATSVVELLETGNSMTTGRFQLGVRSAGTFRNQLDLAPSAWTFGNTSDNPSYTFSGSGTLTTGGIVRAISNGANFDARGTATGSSNVSYMQFTDSGATRTGYVGDGSSGTSNVDLACDAATCVVSLINNGGRTQFTGGQEVRSANDNSFFSHYNTANTTRSGYFQSTTAGVTTLSNDISAGTINIQVAAGSGTVNIAPSGGATQATWTGSGQVMVGATGGAQGSGTINATGLYVNGVSVGAGGTAITVVKPSATDRSSTTTLTSDADLQFTTVSGGTYAVDFCLFFGGVSTGTQGFKFAINLTSAGSQNGMWGGFSQVNAAGATHTGTAMGLGTGSTTGQISYATISVGNGANQVCGSGGITQVGAVTYAVQWAQNSSNANATRLNQGSYIRYTRMQ